MKTTGEHDAGGMVIASHDITGVVLCGGEGRRMGGVEKPLLTLSGQSLVGRVLDRLAPQVGPMIVSANRELAAYRALGRNVISDDEPGLGPLGGLASVAAHVTTPWLFCCPGDAPLLDPMLVARLVHSLKSRDVAAYPHDGERAQYLFLLVRTAVCSSLLSYLEGGARSVQGWLALIEAAAVPVPELAETFVNVNTAEALARLETEN